MLESRPSRTALRVALRRAAHQLLDQPPVFDDPLALRIIGPDQAATIRADPGAYDRHPVARGLRAILAVRSRVAEDALAEAVANDVQQYVVLGAGLDTFSCRNPHPTLRVFEVDHPSTQLWKRAALEQFALPSPVRTTFVPVDFERQSIPVQLAGAGFDPGAPTFFSWLGVTMYLQEETVMSTLGWVASVTHRGGGIVFDYSLAMSELTFLERTAYRMMARRVQRAGEPWISQFVPARLIADLQRLGYARVDDLTPDILNARYFSGRADGLKVGNISHIMHAGT